METFGFLMMSHIQHRIKLWNKQSLMESYGAQTVYIVDSAGALLPHEVREKVRALRQTFNVEVSVSTLIIIFR